MTNSQKILIIHRRNRVDQLAGLPKGCWIEIDIEIHEGAAYLCHDPLVENPANTRPSPHSLDAFIPEALKQGVAGFILDCKRENAEKFTNPILKRHNVTNYFYLNEMEVQADILQLQDSTHQSGLRIWKYRSADDAIKLCEDMNEAKQTAPQWIWVDCWHRGLLQNITRAFLPLTREKAEKLQSLGVKLCICSPELYTHQYNTNYTPEELADFYNGIINYRHKIENEGINCDAICTKFPWLWTLNLELLRAAHNKIGALDFGAYKEIKESDVQNLPSI